MRTAVGARNRGVAGALLSRLVEQARRRGYRRLSLETGSVPYFEPARALYLKHGCTYCGAFADYRDDSPSVFMTRDLQGAKT
jgi:putative acetyltransferase